MVGRGSKSSKSSILTSRNKEIRGVTWVTVFDLSMVVSCGGCDQRSRHSIQAGVGTIDFFLKKTEGVGEGKEED